MSRSKLANRSDRKLKRSRVPHNGLSLQKHGKFLMPSPEEIRAQQKNARTLAMNEAERRGLAVVSLDVAQKLAAHGIPIESPRLDYTGVSTTHANLSLVPLCCAALVKQWQEAQVFAGPAGHIKEFRELSLDRVCWLAAEEWRELKKRTS